MAATGPNLLPGVENSIPRCLKLTIRGPKSSLRPQNRLIEFQNGLSEAKSRPPVAQNQMLDSLDRITEA